VAWLTTVFLPVLGLASAALLFLLPVLYAATRGGTGPGVLTALLSAAAYNYFLLPPRFTLRIHGLENLISVFVLIAVALVTSRLATRLMARETEALERARQSDEVAGLSSLLSGAPTPSTQALGLGWITDRYGECRLYRNDTGPECDAGFSSLDRAAAAWALHNGEITGHGSAILPAADWTVFPLAPRNRRHEQVAAVARPGDGRVRSAAEIEHIAQLALLLGQCLDRNALEVERKERENLEEGDRLRRTFLASLAHDFRTPLTIITGRLALLAQNNPDAHDALVAAQRLDRMMTNLVGAAQIEAGSLRPSLESVDLIDICCTVCDRLAVPTGVSLVRAIPADLPFIRTDPVLLHHILANLVDNALRHAASCITLGACRREDGIVFSISDDGPGVQEMDRTRIFGRFVRLEGSDRNDGSGLGLAIVKGFADSLNVPVSVDTAPEGGARFSLTLPLFDKASA